MRRIINGKSYDTKTADFICDVSPTGFYQGDFRFENTGLYKSPRGTFFLSGHGGPLSRWSEPEGQSGRRGGNGIQVIDLDEAKALVARHASVETFTEAFGEPEEG